MISPRMQALLSKIAAAEAAHYAGLRESARQDKATPKAKPLAERRRPTWSIAKSSAKKRWPS